CDRCGRGQVVDLKGPCGGDGGLERGAVGEESLMEPDGGRDLCRHEFLRHDQPVDLVPLREEQLAEVGAVLAGDPSDQGATAAGRHGPTVAAGPATPSAPCRTAPGVAAPASASRGVPGGAGRYGA